jgi:hypothetical protein
MRYLKATLQDGRAVIGEFAKLAKVQRYVIQVLSGQRPFNVWHETGSVNPVNGEAVRVRTREMVFGNFIRSIEEVDPAPGYETTHQYEPSRFLPHAEVEHGEFGVFIAPRENCPEGLVPGGTYTVHRDPQTLRKYVIAQVFSERALPGGEVAQDPERRHYLDPEGQPVTIGLVEGDDDSSFDDDEPAF